MAIRKEKIKVCAIVQGGVVQAFLHPTSIDAFTFDWDDFKVAPVEYWDTYNEADKEFIRAFDSEMYTEITALYESAKAFETER